MCFFKEAFSLLFTWEGVEVVEEVLMVEVVAGFVCVARSGGHSTPTVDSYILRKNERIQSGAEWAEHPWALRRELSIFTVS